MKATTLAIAAVAGLVGFSTIASAEVLATPEEQYRHQADRRGYGGPGGPLPLPNNGYYGGYYGGLPLGAVLGGAPFYNDRVVINDWRAYGLERPPRGHRWVRIGNQFQLQRR
jgi:hypothetical protein